MNSLVLYTGSCLILWEFMINVYMYYMYISTMHVWLLHVHVHMYTRKSLVCVTRMYTYVSATKEDTQGKQCNVQYIYV